MYHLGMLLAASNKKSNYHWLKHNDIYCIFSKKSGPQAWFGSSTISSRTRFSLFFHSFSLRMSAFSFTLETSCPKTAAVTPGITSSYNPGRSQHRNKREVFPRSLLAKTRLHGHPGAARETGKAKKEASKGERNRECQYCPVQTAIPLGRNCVFQFATIPTFLYCSPILKPRINHHLPLCLNQLLPLPAGPVMFELCLS